ncbi:MAG: leucine-rich repeat protein [Prevotella sp.]|nr:leucine-rich repeat protein [Alistipes senegalensis]MCM1357228.1 leucine-rich repeat protein [Prevotella sp.]MCM1472856.1 leucine-rich repeat protein [Muribaculaceae bacterium]
MKKRLLAMASAAVMSGMLSLMAVPSSSLFAGAAESQTYGDLTYKNYGNWIEITDCDTSVVSVEIPDKIDGKTVRDIGDNAFSGCSELSQIIIPDCVKNIKQSAFNGCSNLTTIDLPDNLSTIGSCAFANCGFTEVTIPESVVTIDCLAFAATPITTITIPKNVETIGEGAFFCGPWGRGTLTEINVDAQNTSFSVKDGVLFNYDQTELLCYPAGKKDTEYTMPETVTTLYVYAFDCCVNLEYITISDDVKVIPQNAFADCLNLKEITIPASNTLIDKTAFAGCSQLVSVYMPKSVESICYSAFQFCSSLTDVYYAGTEEEWNKIKNDSNEIIKANIHYNYNGNTEKVKGDVNADGVFSVADVILLQKWLLAVPNTHLADWKAADFYEDSVLDVFDLCLMKRALIETSISGWKEPEDDETNRAIAKQIGDYALKELKNGTYTLETEIFLSNSPEMMNEEMAEVFLNSDFFYLSFVDEHTVLLKMDKGLLDAYGYLITDESITFNENEYVSVPDEGDMVYIEWAGDHLYYFSAGK